jgi:hypothetical protein
MPGIMHTAGCLSTGNALIPCHEGGGGGALVLHNLAASVYRTASLMHSQPRRRPANASIVLHPECVVSFKLDRRQLTCDQCAAASASAPSTLPPDEIPRYDKSLPM